MLSSAAMAVRFPFVSAFLCERILTEQDGIASAIRLVDIFQVPENAVEHAVVQFWAVVTLRALPVPDDEISVGVFLVRTSGERTRLPDPPPDRKFKMRDFNPDLTLPGGLSLMLQLNVKPKNAGTCFLEIEVDGEVVTRIPFTIRHIPATPTL